MALDMSFRLPSFQKQQLITEFASLRYACPKGVYMSIAPGDATRWMGVLFVRKGPYASAILRFQMDFPSRYPSVPPVVVFTTEIFHPLITPLTTYTYTAGATDDDTVSAADDERLPPGGFTLRHGFPHWFVGNQRSAASSRNVSSSGVSGFHHYGVDVPGAEVLSYILSTFDDEEVLNSIPLEAAANSGAYHAWQSRKRYDGGDEPLLRRQVKEASDAAARRPGQWNWEGVWEERVRRGIQASLSEAVLFGSAGDDMIRFTDLDEEAMEKIMGELGRKEVAGHA